jgi:peptidoglycan-N-acetylglucosamine deacetylase
MKLENNLKLLSLIIFILFSYKGEAQVKEYKVNWPEGKKIALSLTFDDARMSQVDVGTAIFDQYGVKATFYVVPSSVKQRLEGWKKAVANGHEMGNHSVTHPCSGNFQWSRKNALEDYTLDKMRMELLSANKQIQELLGVKPEVFAYPCGQKFVGSGIGTKSYVPLIAELFLNGRGWMDEEPNDPGYCDMSQSTGIEMDGKDFEDILPILEKAKATGQWVILGGHEIGEKERQTTRVEMLKKLLEYAQNPANGIWIAPVGTVTKHINGQRK